ncbi:MAG: helix-turn-helix transcriptional regulator [Clostridia bacterium]|nr:helix-turn-helix transcriptional regulator [Clostridia bacterium]
MLDMELLGRRLADLRHHSGRTQREIAEYVGVSIQALSKWERGLACPDMLILDELALSLGVEISDLFSNQIKKGDESE